MFSLIITIISITLVAALALATIYYGGSSFTKGSTDAQAAQVINEGQQVSAAFTLFSATEGQGVSGGFTPLLDGGYLKQVPAGEWALIEGHAVKLDLSQDQCLAANQKLGISTVPACSDPAYSGTEVCCTVSE